MFIRSTQQYKIFCMLRNFLIQNLAPIEMEKEKRQWSTLRRIDQQRSFSIDDERARLSGGKAPMFGKRKMHGRLSLFLCRIVHVGKMLDITYIITTQ